MSVVYARATRLLGVTLFAAVLSSTTAVGATESAGAFEVRLKKLEAELRCLVCQNQTLADSNASLADDLRREVRELAIAGKTDDEIRAYLVARYGDFVLYDPPLKSTTTLLWIGPFALLVFGTGLWWVVMRSRQSRVTGLAEIEPSESEIRARALLEGVPGKQGGGAVG